MRIRTRNVRLLQEALPCATVLFSKKKSAELVSFFLLLQELLRSASVIPGFVTIPVFRLPADDPPLPLGNDNTAATYQVAIRPFGAEESRSRCCLRQTLVAMGQMPKEATLEKASGAQRQPLPRQPNSASFWYRRTPNSRRTQSENVGRCWHLKWMKK